MHPLQSRNFVSYRADFLSRKLANCCACGFAIQAQQFCDVLKRESKLLSLLNKSNSLNRSLRIVPIFAENLPRLFDQPASLIVSDRLNVYPSRSSDPADRQFWFVVSHRQNLLLIPYHSTGRRLVADTKSETERRVSSPKRFLVAGVITAFAASICCIGPILLLSLGIGGAWISSLTRRSPSQTLASGLLDGSDRRSRPDRGAVARSEMKSTNKRK